MNAFTRQEITAVSIDRSGKHSALKPDQLLPGHVRHAYLPIVDLRSTRIVGYQATAFAAREGFDCLRMQIMNSPASGLLLMEMQAAECLSNDRCRTNHMCALFSEEAWTDRELVIHLRYAQDGEVWPAMQLQRQLQARGIGFAVSWEGCPGLLSLDAMIDARLIRFDAAVLAADESQSEIVMRVLQLARKLGIQTMLAEVSDGDQLELARKLGIDWLQGPLFNRMKIVTAA